MPNYRIHKRKRKKEIILLSPILLLALILTFYPHLNYPYPLHVDEWFHITQAKQISLNKKIDWYSRKEFKLGLERGWHLFLALIQKTFNLNAKQWICLPSIFHLLAIFSTYLFVLNFFGKKQALISAFLIALIPSNVTIGGPVFLVPVNLSLIFIPLALLFAFGLLKIKRIYNYLALFSILTFILYAHPPTAIVLLIILGIYFLLNFFSKDKEARERLKFLFLTTFLSVLVSIPNYLPEIQKKGLEAIKFDFWIYLKEIPSVYGTIPTIFFVLGFYFLSHFKNKEVWSLLLSSIFLILIIVLFARFGLNFLIPYQRTYIPLFLLMSIIASFGYSKLLEIKKPFKNFGLFLLFICLTLTAYFAIKRDLKTPYYHLINDKDYENFLWIKENSEPNAIVLLDPWKARAFPAIAERKVYAVMPFGPNKEYLKLVENAYRFFAQKCTNTTFLIENNISIIYSPVKCQNDDLIEVKENIYILK